MSATIKSIVYNKLYKDFVKGKFDEYPNPLTPDWEMISNELSPQSDIQQKAKHILKNQNSDLTSEKAKTYLQMLDDPASEIIITGQQLGLFLSPVYTIYKAITVINLVEKLNQEVKNQKKYIPVFWLESEDHDFPEINHFGLWDAGMQPQTLTYSGQDYQKKSIRHYHITEEISLLFDELNEQLIQTEFTSDLISLLKSIYAPGANWLKATRTFFKHLLHDQGLLFFEPGDREIKESVGSIFYSDAEKHPDYF